MKVLVACLAALALSVACRSADDSRIESVTYSLQGSVEFPGDHLWQSDLTLFEAVMAARPLPGVSDLAHVQLTRAGEDGPLVIRADLQAMIENADSSFNVKVEPGDRIVVPGK